MRIQKKKSTNRGEPCAAALCNKLRGAVYFRGRFGVSSEETRFYEG